MRQKGQAFALLGALAFAVGPVPVEEPAWLERWLFNPRERTARALEADARGAVDEAAAALETALRLATDDPLARYNAGTARLRTGAADAEALLESAAVTGRGEEATRALYNLGNARLEADDPAGAVQAYRDALRRAPDLADAKFNLELAQRLLEEQKQEPPPREQEQEQEQEQQDDETGSGQEPEADEQEPEDEQQDPRRGDGTPRDGGERPRPLPQFRDLPDMTAEEAAAILEAVENMERERRREEAEQTARSQARTRKDW